MKARVDAAASPLGWGGPVRQWEIDDAREAYPTRAERLRALKHARLHHDYASLRELCDPYSAPVLWGAEEAEARRLLRIASDACIRSRIGRPSSWLRAWRTILVLTTIETA